jgi:ribose transport system ATP-binding protein
MTDKSAAGQPTALEARNLAKRFGGQLALAGVDLTVRQGQVVALLGENGSGKSTLVKILAGYHVPEPGGELRIAGRQVPLPVPPGGYREIGLSFVFQDLGLAPGLRVMENLFVGHRTSARAGALQPIRWRFERRSASSVLGSYQVDLDPDAVTGGLRPTDQALLAIVRAAEELREFRERPANLGSLLGLDGSQDSVNLSGVLVLDEPTVFLPEHEKVFLLDLVRRVAADGTAVLFVSHDMTSVRQIANHAVVLRDGRVVGDVEMAEVSDADLVQLIAGHRLASRMEATTGPASTGPATTGQATTGPRTAVPATVPPTAVPATAVPVTGAPDAEGKPLRIAGQDVGAVALAADGVSAGRLTNASLTVRSGEIVAAAGLLGSGAEDLPYALFGGLHPTAGRLTVGDWSGEVAGLAPRQAISLGLALVPADRKQQGAAAALSVGENMMSLVLGDYFRRGLLAHGGLRRTAAERGRRYGVRPDDPRATLASLSGGNQQRVVLAKWLERPPKMLLLHEPTQGVDVSTRADIYELMRSLAKQGVGILWVSTDFDELAAVADRIVVCAGGSVVGEVPGPPFSREKITSEVYAASAGQLAEGA